MIIHYALLLNIVINQKEPVYYKQVSKIEMLGFDVIVGLIHLINTLCFSKIVESLCGCSSNVIYAQCFVVTPDV